MIDHKKITGTKYVVFRVDKTYKTVGAIGGFQGHMTRTFNTPNANPSKAINNRILIGTKEIKNDVEEYIEGIKLRKNGNIARDILLTASPEFFRERTGEDLERWIDINIKFLKEKFNDNCTYAVLHMDETTPHIHALIVPKMWNEKQQKYKLRSNVYFDGKERLSKWQDDYSNYLNKEFQELKRGTKGSKAKHVKIQQYYTLVNSNLDDKDFESILALAKNSNLQRLQLKALKETLELYKDKYINKDKKLKISNEERTKLKENLTNLKKDKEVYKETIKAISERYKISQEAIKNIVKEMIKGNNKERER